MTWSWGGSMLAALASTLAHPEWWVMALAGFLVRGGILIVLLPIISLPSAAGVTTSLAPPLEALILGRPSLEGVVLGTLVVGLALGALLLAAFTGSWFDLALSRDAAADEELELGWAPIRGSAGRAFAARLVAHAPTLLALGYAGLRLGTATYEELLSPGDASLPMAARVILRAPDATLVLLATWLVAEAAGGLAARRVTAGEPIGSAIWRAFRVVLERRGLATLLLTSLVVAAILVPFTLAVGRSWDRVRAYLFDQVTALELGAALILLVGAWVLGLAFLGGALAWRATAWSTLVAPRRVSEGRPGVSMAPETAAVAANEVAPG